MRMKPLLITLLIAGYVAIGVFSVFGMHARIDTNMQGHGTTSSNCIAAMVKGVTCPKETSPIDFASFHIEAFKEFSLATFGGGLLVSLLILTLLVIGIGLGKLLSKYLTLLQPNLAYSRHRPRQFSSPPKQQFLYWLSLHENSPAVF